MNQKNKIWSRLNDEVIDKYKHEESLKLTFVLSLNISTIQCHTTYNLIPIVFL